MQILAASRAVGALALLALPLTALSVSAPASSGAPGDWPQWRGPNRDGISPETDWKTEGRAAWERRVGLGYSTVSVVGDRVYTAGWDEEKGEDVVWCLKAGDGALVWEHRYPAKKWDKFHKGGTNSTPSVGGDNVFVFNREGRFTCLDAATGEEKWTWNVAEELGIEIPTWGLAASPLVLDEGIVVNAGKVILCDAETGEPSWTTESDYGHAYSTPSDGTLAGKAVLAVFAGKGIVILDRRSGKELAFHEWKTQYDVNAASPVLVGDDRIFISSGYNHGAAMLRFTGEALEPLWETKEMRNKMATALLIGDHLYGLDDGLLKCFDLEGEEQWSERSLGMGAMSAAGDRLLIVSEDGELVVAKAAPAGFEELAREKLVDGSVNWSMPVLANGRVYVRNQGGHLVCRDHRATDQ